MTTIELGPLAAMPDGIGRRVDVGDDRIAVFRLGDEVHAIGDRCSHAEASLSEGEVVGNEVECPRHGALFDITTGAPLSLPATKSVPTHQVEILEGMVLLTVGEESHV